jgi:hypothetical protein
VDANHALLAKKLEQVDSPMTIVLEKQLGKKKFNVSSFELSEFLVKKFFFKRTLCYKNDLCKTLAFCLSKITYLFNLWILHG